MLRRGKNKRPIKPASAPKLKPLLKAASGADDVPCSRGRAASAAEPILFREVFLLGCDRDASDATSTKVDFLAAETNCGRTAGLAAETTKASLSARALLPPCQCRAATGPRLPTRCLPF